MPLYDAPDLAFKPRCKGLESKQQKITAWLESRLGKHIDIGNAFNRVPLPVQRSLVFDSSVDHILAATHAELVAGLNVMFLADDGKAEAGIDSGGLTREWFHTLTKEFVANPYCYP